MSDDKSKDNNKDVADIDNEDIIDGQLDNDIADAEHDTLADDKEADQIQADSDGDSDDNGDDSESVDEDTDVNDSPAIAEDSDDSTENEDEIPVTFPNNSNLSNDTETVAVVHKNDAVTLVLQWLTYAFWGWFAISIIWLSAFIFSFLVNGRGDTDWASVIPYPIATLIVLYLVSLAVDFAYRRNEPAKKEGFALFIMVIHAVIFAVCCIAALVAGVFAGINMLIKDTPTDVKSAQIVLFTAFTVMPVYGLLICRTILTSKVKLMPIVNFILLGGLSAVFVILAIAGPINDSINTRQDRKIETALPVIIHSIGNYADDNGKLPDELKDINFSKDTYGAEEFATVSDVVKNDLVKYTPNNKAVAINLNFGSDDSTAGQVKAKSKFYYKLCVNYIAERNSDYNDYVGPLKEKENPDASSSVNVYRHGKGEQCYNLVTSGIGAL